MEVLRISHHWHSMCYHSWSLTCGLSWGSELSEVDLHPHPPATPVWVHVSTFLQLICMILYEYANIPLYNAAAHIAEAFAFIVYIYIYMYTGQLDMQKDDALELRDEAVT